MPRLSRVQVAKACETAARLTRFSPAPDAEVHRIPAELTTPFEGVQAIAWNNGQRFYCALGTVKISMAHPRSRSVTLPADARVH